MINRAIHKVLSANLDPLRASVSVKLNSIKTKTSNHKPQKSLLSQIPTVESKNSNMTEASFKNQIEWRKILWLSPSRSNLWKWVWKLQRTVNWKVKWKVFCMESRKYMKIWNSLLKTFFTVSKRWKMSFRLTYCKYPASFWNLVSKLQKWKKSIKSSIKDLHK